MNLRGDINISELVKAGSTTSFINLYNYYLLTKDDNYKKQLDEIENIYIDGIALVWLLNIARKVKYKRFSFDFTSIAHIFFKELESNNHSLYIVGGKENVASEFSENIVKSYKSLKIVGTSHGYINDYESLKENIITSGARVVLIGMGAPFQDYAIKEISSIEGISVITCGGFLDQYKNQSVYYPEFFDRFNLRWMFRLYREPKRLFTRYFIKYPIGAIFFLISELNK